ncbi:MAG: hypothetical protein EOP49_00845 [Sphingobacteriales bacterium]|nr:MAG: hypothetical protein EOP49_00845 [Sphingobacteriales bacterium]
MAQRTLTGTLTIPSNEPSAGGVYTDISIQLFLMDDQGVETQIDSHDIPTTNDYSFTFDDLGQQALVKIARTSTGTVLSSTPARGVLPRSFLLPSTDPAFYTDFKVTNYLWDAGLSILATASRTRALATEIMEGVLKANVQGVVPFQVNHVTPLTPTPDAYLHTGTIALVAYSLGYYLEKNPLALNTTQVGAKLYTLLQFLTRRINITGHGLITAGQGQYVNGNFDPSYVDGKAHTVDNILAFFAYKQAGKVLNGYFDAAAEDLYSVIMVKLWEPIGQYFHGGFEADGQTFLPDNLETQVLGLFMLKEQGELVKSSQVLSRIESTYACVDTVNGVSAYKATQADTSVWFEGSYMVAVCYRKMNNSTKYGQIVKALNRFLQADGSFQFGVIKDGQYQVKTWESVGSTAWSILANKFPTDVFTIRDTASVPPGVINIHINSRYENTFFNQTCPTGTTAQPFVYYCPVGYMYHNLFQSVVDSNAQDFVNDFGQSLANQYGVCQVPFTHFNTYQSGVYQKQGCGSGLIGTFYTVEVQPGTFGSYVSVQDANDQATAWIIANGQTLANQNGSCVANIQYVSLSVILSSFPGQFGDEIYATAYASQPVQTNVDLNYDYGPFNQFYGNADITIQAGASNSQSVLVTTVPSGEGDFYVCQSILSVTPTSYGNQVYI